MTILYFVPLTLFLIYRVIVKVHRTLTSPLRNIRGPPSQSFLLGNSRQSVNVHLSIPWFEQYGPTLKSNLVFGEHGLFTRDTKAVHHILGRTDVFEKPEAVKFLLAPIMGHGGVSLVDGEQHKRQRKVLNPAFSPNQLRQYTQIFHVEAQKLRDQLAKDASKDNSVNFFSIVSQTTMQILGICGFACDLKEDGKELGAMLTKAFQSKFSFQTLRAYVPILRIFPNPADKALNAARAEMWRIGMKLIEDMKDRAAGPASEKEAISKDDIAGRDLLSLLIRANMAKDLTPSQRLTDEEVITQIPTFLIAGSETTAISTSWAIYSMCKRPDVQAKLRDELFSIKHENPTMEELNSLKYLDTVLRESLRLFPPLGSTSRVANKDDVIPLTTPIKDKNGKELHHVEIRKGQTAFVNFKAMHVSEEVWGDDAMEFKPERWEKELPPAVLALPGIWGNTLAFGGGPRSCIGFQFSLVEAKAILFCLIRAFEFRVTIPIEMIYPRATVVIRPSFNEEPSGMNNLPVSVTPYVRKS